MIYLAHHPRPRPRLSRSRRFAYGALFGAAAMAILSGAVLGLLVVTHRDAPEPEPEPEPAPRITWTLPV